MTGWRLTLRTWRPEDTRIRERTAGLSDAALARTGRVLLALLALAVASAAPFAMAALAARAVE